MAKKYIQIKPNTLGKEYEGRSFLVTDEDDDNYIIKRGTVFVPKEHAIVCNNQSINLEAQDVYATLVKNHNAIFKVVPAPWLQHGMDARIKVEQVAVEDGQLILFFGEEYNTEEGDGEITELWVVAHRCVLDIQAKVYDAAFFTKAFPEAFKQKQDVVELAFVEGVTKTIFIMHDKFINPINGEVTQGFSIRHGSNFITSFAQFATLDELKASELFARVLRGEYN